MQYAVSYVQTKESWEYCQTELSERISSIKIFALNFISFVCLLLWILNMRTLMR